MNILITGAAGCLGNRVVSTLTAMANDKQPKSALKIFATDIKENPFANDENLIYQRFDLRSNDFSLWVEKIRPDKIVHLASILQISKQITREIAHEIDVISTQKLLEQAVNLKVDKFIGKIESKF